MAGARYTASKVRDAGRDRYSVIFRHPVRLDTTGRPGRRVRRGLGTSDSFEADRIVAQLNELLANEEYWNLTARIAAEGRFHPRAVSAFYDGMEPSVGTSSRDARDRLLPLPSLADGYKRILLLGTTGAGKTTVVRQLLGTNPKTDRFPSTSTAKTTTADTEIIISPEGPFRAVVTFVPRDEVVDHLVDCASKAALAALRGASDNEVYRLLLDHEDQRFRFSYVLGRERHVESAIATSRTAALDDFQEFDRDEQGVDAEAFDAEPGDLVGVDPAATAAVVKCAIATLRDLIKEHEGQARAQLGAHGDADERVAQEILEEELDAILRNDERFNATVDTILTEIEKRFDAVTIGTVARDQQSWPSTWSLESDDRLTFLRAVNRFSSNYAPLFGHLLTPLVDGVRVFGPFGPAWLPGAHPKLVLVDGEGLGHTPKSSAALPTAVARRIEEVDAVLLVDSAAQPIQAAPASAIRSLLTSGNTDKLVFCFTHFDEVEGDNLLTGADRARHVLASVENLLSTIRDEFGPRSERALRRRLDHYRFFLADIDRPLDPDTRSGRLSIGQLSKLLAALETITDRPATGSARPVYDKANLVLATTAASKSFHRRWKAVLGISYEADVDKEHWSRVKALNRRFAEGTADQYDTLRPASELRELLKDELYKTLEAPLRWKGGQPDDETTTAIVNEMSHAIAKRLMDLVHDRLSVRPQQSWQDTYRLYGPGSTFTRARRISDDVFSRNVPVPGAAPSPDQNDFLHSVIRAVEEAAGEIGVDLV